MRRPVAFLLALLVAGCGPADTDPGPGGVTVGEAKALDEAAEMLEQRRLPAEALPAGTPTPTPTTMPTPTPTPTLAPTTTTQADGAAQ